MYRSVEVKVRTPPIGKLQFSIEITSYSNSVLKSLTIWPFFLTFFLYVYFPLGARLDRGQSATIYMYSSIERIFQETDDIPP